MQTKTALLKTWLKNIVIYGALFIVISVAVDWYRKPSSPVQFASQVLTDTQNQPQIIAQLSHEKTMLLYFWGSWCHFCQITSPAVDRLAQEGVPVLGVALKSGSPESVNAYLAENGYHFPTLNDPNGEFSKLWDIQATPTILIIKNGEIKQYPTGLTTYWGLKARMALAY